MFGTHGSNLTNTKKGSYGGTCPAAGEDPLSPSGYYPSLVDALQQYEPNLVRAMGAHNASSPADPELIAEAVRLAKSADAVIMAIGTDLTMAHEAKDATSLELSDGQRALIAAVTAAAKSPIICVLFTGIPLDISTLLENPRVGAIVHVGQPGVQTLGIADVLFGKISPAGRTHSTMYPKSYAGQISIFDM